LKLDNQFLLIPGLNFHRHHLFHQQIVANVHPLGLYHIDLNKQLFHQSVPGVDKQTIYNHLPEFGGLL
jgi:hypothetical protein